MSTVDGMLATIIEEVGKITSKELGDRPTDPADGHHYELAHQIGRLALQVCALAEVVRQEHSRTAPR